MGDSIITFMSDFGHQDWFAGVVHGVIHEVCPGARVVDLNHSIEPGDIGRAAFIDPADRYLGMYPTAPYSFPRLMEDCCICQPAAFWTRRAV